MVTVTCTRQGAVWTLPLDALHACAGSSVLGTCMRDSSLNVASRYMVYKDDNTLHLMATEVTASYFVDTVLGVYQESGAADVIPPKAREFIMTLLAPTLP